MELGHECPVPADLSNEVRFSLLLVVLSFFCGQPENAKLSWCGTGAVCSGSILGRSNSKGIKITAEKELAFVSHLQRVGPSKKSSRK